MIIRNSDDMPNPLQPPNFCHVDDTRFKQQMMQSMIPSSSPRSVFHSSALRRRSCFVAIEEYQFNQFPVTMRLRFLYWCPLIRYIRGKGFLCFLLSLMLFLPYIVLVVFLQHLITFIVLLISAHWPAPRSSRHDQRQQALSEATCLQFLDRSTVPRSCSNWSNHFVRYIPLHLVRLDSRRKPFFVGLLFSVLIPATVFWILSSP